MPDRTEAWHSGLGFKAWQQMDAIVFEYEAGSDDDMRRAMDYCLRLMKQGARAERIMAAVRDQIAI